MSDETVGRIEQLTETPPRSLTIALYPDGLFPFGVVPRDGESVIYYINGLQVSRAEARAVFPEAFPVDHRELLRKFIQHTFKSEPNEQVSTESAAKYIMDWIGSGADASVPRRSWHFTAEEKAELVRLASEESIR